MVICPRGSIFEAIRGMRRTRVSNRFRIPEAVLHRVLARIFDRKRMSPGISCLGGCRLPASRDGNSKVKSLSKQPKIGNTCSQSYAGTFISTSTWCPMLARFAPLKYLSTGITHGQGCSCLFAKPRMRREMLSIPDAASSSIVASGSVFSPTHAP